MKVRLGSGSANSAATAAARGGKERLLVLGCVAVVIALGGAQLLAWENGAATQWSAAHGWLVFVMWAAMMAAIMTPSAAPELLAYASRGRDGEVPAGRSPPAFLAGYLALWTGISAAAALAHWGLHAARLLTPGIAIENPVAGGMLLMSAGAFQLTPLKAGCLARGRAATRYRSAQGREGAAGAFVTGLSRALYSVARCWPLMALLFVGSVMSPLWIVVLTLIAMAQEILPYGESVARGVAAGAIGWGLWMLAGTLA